MHILSSKQHSKIRKSANSIASPTFPPSPYVPLPPCKPATDSMTLFTNSFVFSAFVSDQNEGIQEVVVEDGLIWK